MTPDPNAVSMRRGFIRTLGMVNSHNLTGWAILGGDFPAVDTANGRICGWDAHELTAALALADAFGPLAALTVADHMRDLPIMVRLCCQATDHPAVVMAL